MTSRPTNWVNCCSRCPVEFNWVELCRYKRAFRNSTRYRHSYNEILVGTDKCPTQVVCHFKRPRVTLSDFAKYSMTRSIARSLCDSSASCDDDDNRLRCHIYGLHFIHPSIHPFINTHKAAIIKYKNTQSTMTVILTGRRLANDSYTSCSQRHKQDEEAWGPHSISPAMDLSYAFHSVPCTEQLPYCTSHKTNINHKRQKIRTRM